MSEADQTVSDVDAYVTVRLDGDRVVVEVSPAGFRQPMSLIGNLVTELVGRLPRPGAEADEALANGIAAISGLQRAAASGGYEAFAAGMRARLGIEGPANTLSRDPEFDRTIAVGLEGILKSMRDSSAKRSAAPEDVLTAEVYTDEGDIGVTARSDRIVAGVWIGPEARSRGVEGLGRRLTSLVAEARAALEELADAKAREGLPEAITQVVEEAPEHAKAAEQRGMSVIGEATQMTEAMKRKAGRA
ncbi:hypothetical protein K3N28_12725 [Glycomyces sp. TRM65418]|uniref:hypothetical protein n=1 Tax=Glycomyces sp. TRM65418 TaxID=2867006 RepID=UPI001CE52FE9|nr:hypothetical protein [Glycomyces sp. TRM65418]MCC3763929.1 hypothetical protein [Glycomyces sp. TRM65418]QZD53631.1 hypothetical protein K3N28_12655 [Glycomyces sp. TRM65418]